VKEYHARGESTLDRQIKEFKSDIGSNYTIWNKLNDFQYEVPSWMGFARLKQNRSQGNLRSSIEGAIPEAAERPKFTRT